MRVLVSSCLLGETVRYDGGHKRDAFLVETLGKYVEYVPVCPETECGLPTPREPMRLAGDAGSPRLMTWKTGIDHTDRMLGWAGKKLDEIESLDVWAYICKKDSPSSGKEGIFTREFLKRFPLVPVEGELHLDDPDLRDMFVERVFVMRRFRNLALAGRTRSVLVGFHADHKLLLMSRDRRLCSRMGELVAWSKGVPAADLHARYQEMLLEALNRRATVAKRTGALLHAAGSFRKLLAPAEKGEVHDAIAGYRAGALPLAVPVVLLRHYVHAYDMGYLRRQVFLFPHPLEMMLRNHA